MIDPSARVHATADLEPTSPSGRARASGTAPRSGPARRSAPSASSAVTCSSTRASSIGDRVKIQNAALVYHGVTVEDGVFIGPGAILTNDRYPRAITSTGDLARAERLDGLADRAPRTAARSVPARSSSPASTSAGSRWSAPAPSSPASVPSHALVVGNPAHRIGWVCACGARLVDADGDPAPAEPGRRTPPTRELICGSCGRDLRLRPRRRVARGADRPPSRSTRMIPIARPDIGPGGDRRPSPRSSPAAWSPRASASPSSRSAGPSSVGVEARDRDRQRHASR